MLSSKKNQTGGTITKDHLINSQKTTSQDEDKKYKLIKKLTSHSADQFRQLDINEFDLNFTEHFQELEYIDDAVTPLIYCAHYGLKEICRFLLKNQNIDVDQQTNNNKQTALIVACMNGNYEIARHLILAKAQVNKPNSLNNNPLATVLYRLVEETYSFENKKICFLIAELLLQNGADPNWIIEKTKGYSLLHYFCASKMKMNKTQKLINEEIIKFLLEHGADPELKTLKDQNAFDLVKTHCNKEKIEQILTQYRLKKLTKQKNTEEKTRKKSRNYTEEFIKIQFKQKDPLENVQSKFEPLNNLTKQQVQQRQQTKKQQEQQNNIKPLSQTTQKNQ